MRIGFMQGRLSSKVDGKIQAFPWLSWEQEFAIASQYEFQLMEWTLDYEKLYENPLMTQLGRKRILQLCSDYGVLVQSLTGDCFMQAPFYKNQDLLIQDKLLEDAKRIIEACNEMAIRYIVMPLVDSGSLEYDEQEMALLTGLEQLKPVLQKGQCRIIFESDYTPQELRRLLSHLDHQYFGINYDIGNSTSLGFDPNEEIKMYGNQIYNVHVKDRLCGGPSVALGEGNADFKTVFNLLKKINYQGNYILQTARANNEDHVGTLVRYRDQVRRWIYN